MWGTSWNFHSSKEDGVGWEHVGGEGGGRALIRVLMMHHEHSWFNMSINDADDKYLDSLLDSRSKIWHPICHQMGRHGTWEDFNHTNIDCCLDAASVVFEVVRFPRLVFRICFVSNIILGWSRNTQRLSRDHRGSILGQLESPGTLFCWSDLSRIQKSSIKLWWNPLLPPPSWANHKISNCLQCVCLEDRRADSVMLKLSPKWTRCPRRVKWLMKTQDGVSSSCKFCTPIPSAPDPPFLFTRCQMSRGFWKRVSL